MSLMHAVARGLESKLFHPEALGPKKPKPHVQEKYEKLLMYDCP